MIIIGFQSVITDKRLTLWQKIICFLERLLGCGNTVNAVKGKPPTPTNNLTPNNLL
ncbi:MAG: hypothetical protein LBE12_15115 [Planctomycetaceae bacterium]|nr:hypothetical protein [Planctomycetaceae bacterium]